jgi:hypothetical protein
MNDNASIGKAALHAPPPGPPRPPAKVLTYARGVWGQTTDPVTDDADFLEAAAAAGYRLLHQHGVEGSALWL